MFVESPVSLNYSKLLLLDIGWSHSKWRTPGKCLECPAAKRNLMLGKCSALNPAGNGSARNSQDPQEEQLHTGILTPLSRFCVSLNAIGEECWSLPQGYTEVSEVSAAGCWGEGAATHRQHHGHKVFLVCLSLHVIRERGRHWLTFVSNIRSPVVTGIVAFSSTPITGCLNTSVWRKPFPSWNCERVASAPALKENET